MDKTLEQLIAERDLLLMEHPSLWETQAEYDMAMEGVAKEDRPVVASRLMAERAVKLASHMAELNEIIKPMVNNEPKA